MHSDHAPARAASEWPVTFVPKVFRSFAFVLALLALLIVAGTRTAYAQDTITGQYDIATPEGANTFGTQVKTLPNGNVVVVDPNYQDFSVTGTGAVFLYDGARLAEGDPDALISTLRGANIDDHVGSGGIVVLPNGKYVVISPQWHYLDSNSIPLANAGAVTLVDPFTGVNGPVTEENSLVGSLANDEVGSGGVFVLPNGNFVVLSPFWNNGAASEAGAVTWVNGDTGVVGAVSTANSLVGDETDDAVGSTGITILTNGNYVVRSDDWSNEGVEHAGAATWASGSAPITGVVSSANSLVGASTGDSVSSAAVVALTNGNYVVVSPLWNGAATQVGAVTWGDGDTGIVGVVSDSNSLVGVSALDLIGSRNLGALGVTALTNGNYVVASPFFDVATTDEGAITWANGATGISGQISPANSILGGQTGDGIGGGGIYALANGNYVISSPAWHNGSAVSVGAATLSLGSALTMNAITSGNSLVGNFANDQVSSRGIVPLSNGNYVVISNLLDGPALQNVGAVTWGSGTTGVSGVVTFTNSLVGTAADDGLGSSGVLEVGNSNYVVLSSGWGGGPQGAGAATWASGTTGINGTVTITNSLVGSTPLDFVGRYATVLTNGNYVVLSPQWENDGMADAGAITWANGNIGITGAVTVSNSIVGVANGEIVGWDGTVYPLDNGDYLVHSPNSIGGNGAVLQGSGTATTSGPITPGNSLVGTSPGDLDVVNLQTWTGTDQYILSLPAYNGANPDSGATMWYSGTAPNIGFVTSLNSVWGIAAGGGVTMTSDLENVNKFMVAGRPADNIVTVGVLPAERYTLTVKAAGLGTGRINASTGAIHNCYTTCSFSYAAGVTVTLSATQTLPNLFDGWSGAPGCTVANAECVVVVTSNMTVSATFLSGPNRKVTIVPEGDGEGTVTSVPSGINCGAVCTGIFANDGQVQLIPSAGVDTVFTGWSGDCAGYQQAPCYLTVSSDYTVTATFDGAGPWTLDVTSSTGGKVTSAPAGIDCGVDCSESLAHNSVITLTATPQTGYLFANWGGEGCPGINPVCVVNMTEDRTISANFVARDVYTLNVVLDGEGSGTVTSNPAGINCGSTCSMQVYYLDTVTLSATPAEGDAISGWGGGVSCASSPTCTITVNQDFTITVTFAPPLGDYEVDIDPNPVTGGTVLVVQLDDASVASGVPGSIEPFSGQNPQTRYPALAQLQLTAVPNDGYEFDSWSGSVSGSQNPIIITVNADLAIGANFTLADTNFYSWLPVVNQ